MNKLYADLVALYSLHSNHVCVLSVPACPHSKTAYVSLSSQSLHSVEPPHVSPSVAWPFFFYGIKQDSDWGNLWLGCKVGASQPSKDETVSLFMLDVYVMTMMMVETTMISPELKLMVQYGLPCLKTGVERIWRINTSLKCWCRDT